jgi:hypothetical protein
VSRSSRIAVVVLAAWTAASCAGRSTRDDGASGSGGTAQPAGGGSGSGGKIDPAACAEPTDCELVERACCAACEPVSLEDFAALNGAFSDDFTSALECGDVLCAPCPPASEEVRPWLGATCRAQQCLAFDARLEEFTACDSNDDCRLRTGLDCCEACGRDDARVVAVSEEAALRALVCPSDHQGCDECEPQYAPDRMAHCVSGHCITLYRGG